MDDLDAWAASGAMGLTGREEGPPLPPPAGLVPGLRTLATRVERASAALDGVVEVDPLALLVERARILRLGRQGTTSCGGSCRLLRARDGWIAVSLARSDDLELVPAWLGIESTGWDGIAAAVAARTARDVEAAGVLLGLPVAVLPTDVERPEPVQATPLGNAPPLPSLDGIVVVDLTSLWAGPLAGALLAEVGATVRKVETHERPDGTRRGPPAFFDRLNGGKEQVSVALADLPDVVAKADVVLEASRPRALEQLGVDAAHLVRTGRPRVWVSITAHGRTGPDRDRVGFGDDAAVAGGLVAWEDGEPRFCADAIADPATGLTAAAACLDALAGGGRWLFDVALARVAASLSTPTT